MRSVLIVLVWVLIPGLWLAACVSPVNTSRQTERSGDYCAPALAYTYDSTYLPLPDIESVLKTDTGLTSHYSRHDLLMANALGIVPLLSELSRLANNKSLDARLERVIKQQQIQNRLLLASTEIASFAAELDCEGERADQLANYLDQRDTRRIRRLTIFSVVVGAATTVVTALIQADNTTKVISIAGGLVSATAGGFAAFSSNIRVPFWHKRNVLSDIWHQPRASSVFPPVVWYALNEKTFSNSGQTSIGYNIRQRWKDYVLDGVSAEDATLYFGAGGNYQADDLHRRANMVNQLQSSVRSIDQDLQGLMLGLAK